MSEFWLSEEQFERLRPLLPSKVRGVARVDDRRVISGIIHVVTSGGRWVDAPACYEPRKTLYNRFVRWAAKGVWQELFVTLAAAGGPPAEVLIDSTHMKAHRSAGGGKGGARPQAIGISRGGRNSKLHALTDGEGRPLRFLLTGGQVADCRAVDVLLNDLAAGTIVLGDKAYDSNAIRDLIERQGAVPNIPSKANRRWKSCFSKTLYKGRNAVERMFGRLKDYRRIATRYDKLATNFLGAIYLAAAVTWWL
ncbi:MAG: IS5 family transposase [Bradyrhizobium sp.]|uniref:IS5 family transposase n=2 Tax=Pseudomonadota TaxID=1224 RepID=A0ABS5GC70_9BRAD|nr:MULTISPECIES: IS5 family transposase [Nitrobacteraceae]MBR1138934.1 IS5 family transposase [Bradyrhizobium denitrificans]